MNLGMHHKPSIVKYERGQVGPGNGTFESGKPSGLTKDGLKEHEEYGDV